MGEINSNNTVEIHKPNLLWDDMQVNINSIRIPTANYPTYTDLSSDGIYYEALTFSASATNYIYFTAQIPHSWYEKSYVHGNKLNFHLHVMPATDAGANQAIRWTLIYSWANVNSVFPASSSTAVVQNISNVAKYTHTIVPIAELNPQGATVSADKRISSVLLCRLARTGGDAADTYTGAVYLLSMDFHIQKDSNGSVGEYNKYRVV